MRKLLTVAAIGALAIPAAATAAPNGQEKQEAKRECSQLKFAAGTKANFVQTVKLENKKATKRNAWGLCLKIRAAKADQENTKAQNTAVAQCRQLFPKGERGKPADKGTRNDFGQCVAQKRRESNQQQDQAQKNKSTNPAKTCRSMQKADAAAFKAKYRNFGKCVSEQAQKRNDAQQS